MKLKDWVESEGPAGHNDKEWSDAMDLSPAVMRVLQKRGIRDLEEAKKMMSASLEDLPDPLLLPDMEKALDRIEISLRNQELIAVHGDYDADGLTGTALLVEGLREMGGRVTYIIPHRGQDGFGLSRRAIEESKKRGVKLIITVDCGSDQEEGAELIHQLGMDLIVTDHHQTLKALHKAHAVVNPHRRESRFPFRGLSGAGVAFFLLLALRRGRGVEAESLWKGLDLVAVGTVCDICPLVSVNRILVTHGLKQLNTKKRAGFEVMLDALRIRSCTPRTIGWRIGPVFNAPDRLGKPSDGVVDLLLAGAEESPLILCRLLDLVGTVRERTETFLQQALAQVSISSSGAPAMVVSGNWPVGHTGLIAARMAHRFQKPAAVIAVNGDKARGSVRGPQGSNPLGALGTTSDLLLSHGGHPEAAGFSLHPEQIPEFERRFIEAQGFWKPNPPHKVYDTEIYPEELSERCARDLIHLGPFGAGWGEPQFLLRRVSIGAIRTRSKNLLEFQAHGENHRFRCLGKDLGGWKQELEAGGTFDLLVRPEIDSFRKEGSVLLSVQDVRVAERSEEIGKAV